MLNPDDYDNLKVLYTSVGPTMTAILTDARQQDDPTAWMNGHKTPDENQRAKLDFARRMYDKIRLKRSYDVARLWFICGDGNKTWPALDIADAKYDEVEADVERFIDSQ